MSNYNVTASRFSLPAFACGDSMKGKAMSNKTETMLDDIFTGLERAGKIDSHEPAIIADSTMVNSSVEGMGYVENITTFVRDIGDDTIALTIMRSYSDKVSGDKVEDFGLDVYGNLFVSRAHARAFAERILEQLGGAGA